MGKGHGDRGFKLGLAYASYWRFKMGKGHGDQQFTPGIGNVKWGKVMATAYGDLKWGKVMATAYAWDWQFQPTINLSGGVGLCLVLVI
jgi:hypothetical protein